MKHCIENNKLSHNLTFNGEQVVKDYTGWLVQMDGHRRKIP